MGRGSVWGRSQRALGPRQCAIIGNRCSMIGMKVLLGPRTFAMIGNECPLIGMRCGLRAAKSSLAPAKITKAGKKTSLGDTPASGSGFMGQSLKTGCSPQATQGAQIKIAMKIMIAKGGARDTAGGREKKFSFPALRNGALFPEHRL